MLASVIASGLTIAGFYLQCACARNNPHGLGVRCVSSNMTDTNGKPSTAEEQQRFEAYAEEDVLPPQSDEKNGADTQAPRDPDAAREPDTGLEIPHLKEPAPGTAPGIEHDQLADMASKTGECRVTVIDYCNDRIQRQVVTDIEDFLVHHRPEWTAVRWINVDGLSDMAVIQALAEKYELHPLAIEDMLHANQRPKVEWYTGTEFKRARLFVLARMVQQIEGKVASEQISMFLGHKTVLTFQETPGDVWDPIRERVKKNGSRLRNNDASFLAYALLDAIVDQCFPILEQFGDKIEDLEDRILTKPTPETVQEVYQLKRQLLLLRRAVWPMREVVISLQREQHECLSEVTRTYLRDVYDHSVQIIDIIETYREMSTSLTETYMNSMSFRMNEVMKVLTIIGTIFIPLTFLAGVYGMNMPIPENTGEFSHYSYPAFWIVCIVISGGLLYYFRRRGWL
jgi:magnesium transporter